MKIELETWDDVMAFLHLALYGLKADEELLALAARLDISRIKLSEAVVKVGQSTAKGDTK